MTCSRAPFIRFHPCSPVVLQPFSSLVRVHPLGFLCETFRVVLSHEQQRQDWPGIVVGSRRVSPMTIHRGGISWLKCQLDIKEEIPCIHDYGYLPAKMRLWMSNH